MSPIIQKTLVRLLREVATKIDSGNCELTEGQMTEIMATISHEVLSKASACTYLNLSRSRFDELVRLGKIPKGRKRKGFKELVWYKDELASSLK